MPIAFTNAVIWNPGADPVEGTLVVEGSKIINVGAVAPPLGAEIVDCGGDHILPGIIDAHTHTGTNGEGVTGDTDNNERKTALNTHLRILDAIHPEDLGFADARRAGITTLGITPGSANPIGGQTVATKATGLVIDEMVLKAPAGIKLALGENPKRVGGDQQRPPQTRMGAAGEIRKAFVDAAEYRADWEHHRARVAAEDKPVRAPRRDLAAEMLVRVLDGEIPVRNHCHRLDDIRTAIRLAEEFGYRLVLDHATEAYRIVDEIVRRNIPVVLGPVLTSRSKRELVHRTPAAIGLMVRAGATVAVMTDSPVNPQNSLRDMVIMAIREGLPQDRALETLTANPAAILGVDDRVGRLAVGLDADFARYDGDPWDARTNVTETWIDGTRVFEREGPYLPR